LRELIVREYFNDINDIIFKKDQVFYMRNSMRIDLSGTWEFGFENEMFCDTILLPSSTEVSEKGEFEVNQNETLHLSRRRPFTGVCRYKRTIVIPEQWKNKQIILHLERTKYTRIMLDGEFVSQSHETIIPQRHILSEPLTVGSHELIIEVDNHLTKYDDFSESLYKGHQYTEDTQTNWNGILGDIYLEALEPIYIESVKIEKVKDESVFQVQVEINNLQVEIDNLQVEINNLPVEMNNLVNTTDAQITLCYQKDKEYNSAKNIVRKVVLQQGYNYIDIPVKDEDLILWDEFHSNLYQFQIVLEGSQYQTSYETITGFRDITTREHSILLNKTPISLRGNLDCCIYPLTGYAPMKTSEWIEIFRQAKEYGINHVRFHSWCPPEAAFEAADREGIYLQVELSCFANSFYEDNNPLCDHKLNHYLKDQSVKLIKEFGNHPSFLIFAVGNEMLGDISAYDELLSKLKKDRPDKLYTQGANNFLEDPFCGGEDDVWITMRTSKTDNVRASFSHGDKPLGHLQLHQPYRTMQDYKEAVNVSKIPVIAHEVGQYQAFPNFDERDKYQGITESTALKVFLDRLKEKGLEQQAKEFYLNSGALMVQCYKEEVEALLRTENLVGFQLLGLQDFPGQGTALIGIWDSFMHSKGFITPSQWREFCGPQVILLKLEKGIYTSREAVKGQVWIYNFGQDDMTGDDLEVTIYRHVISEKGQTFSSFMERQKTDEILGSVTISKVVAPKGQLTYIKDIQIDVKEKEEATAAYIELACGEIKNHYPVWIYPNVKVSDDKNTLIFDTYSDKVEEALKEGRTVGLFTSDWEQSIEGFFPTDFWCYPMFEKACIDKGVEVAPGTLGLVCQKDHKALEHFPTESFSSWQWRRITNLSRPVILDQEEGNCQPIVQVIDNFDRNHKLGLIFEKEVYKGKLVVCSMNLLDHLDLTEVKQLYYSLVQYIKKNSRYQD
jgi:hypothetical protein